MDSTAIIEGQLRGSKDYLILYLYNVLQTEKSSTPPIVSGSLKAENGHSFHHMVYV